jgi:hypothetical protein
MLGVIYTRSSRIMNDVFYDDSTTTVSYIYPFPGHWEIPMLKVEELLKFIAINEVLFY